MNKHIFLKVLEGSLCILWQLISDPCYGNTRWYYIKHKLCWSVQSQNADCLFCCKNIYDIRQTLPAISLTSTLNSSTLPITFPNTYAVLWTTVPKTRIASSETTRAHTNYLAITYNHLFIIFILFVCQFKFIVLWMLMCFIFLSDWSLLLTWFKIFAKHQLSPFKTLWISHSSQTLERLVKQYNETLFAYVGWIYKITV